MTNRFSVLRMIYKTQTIQGLNPAIFTRYVSKKNVKYHLAINVKNKKEHASSLSNFGKFDFK